MREIQYLTKMLVSCLDVVSDKDPEDVQIINATSMCGRLLRGISVRQLINISVYFIFRIILYLYIDISG